MSEEFKVGDSVHMGHALKGGSGVEGTVYKIEGDDVWINSKHNKGTIYKGKVKYLSLQNCSGSYSNGRSRALQELANKHPQFCNADYPIQFGGRVKKMLAEGKTLEEIAKETGYPLHTVKLAAGQKVENTIDPQQKGIEQQGRKAKEAGKTVVDCPYPKGHRDYNAWMFGFDPSRKNG